MLLAVCWPSTSWSGAVSSGGLCALLLPILISTSAPGEEPNVTWTELSRTERPMSRMSPDPCLRPPKYGLLLYQLVAQKVDELLLSTAFEPSEFSLNPVAPAGLSTIVPAPVRGAVAWCVD